MVKRKKTRSTEKIDVADHVLVPKHDKCSENEKKQVLSKFHSEIKDFPKISMHDPALYNVDVKPGDMVKIIRNGQVAGKTIFYRVVIEI